MFFNNENDIYNLKLYIFSIDYNHILITTRLSRLIIKKIMAIKKLFDVN